MSREYKFRAWDSVGKKMYEPDFIDNEYACPANMLGGYWYDGLAIEKEHTLVQYTGLKDRYGKEIYEGDILRWKCSKSGSNRVKDYIVTIQWDRHGYDILIRDDGKWKTQRSYWNDEDRVVIGNIHENPELLEV